MNPIGTHRGLFVTMAAAAVALSAASFLAGLLAGERIVQMLGQNALTTASALIPPHVAAFMCAGALLCVVIGVVGCFSGLGNLLMSSSVTGRIRRSTIRSFPCDDGMEHYIESLVEYRVGGSTFESEGLHRYSSTDEVAVRERLGRISPGDPVRVFFKQGDPDVIDLDEAPKDRWGSILGGAALVAVGLALLFFAGRSLAN